MSYFDTTALVRKHQSSPHYSIILTMMANLKILKLEDLKKFLSCADIPSDQLAISLFHSTAAKLNLPYTGKTPDTRNNES